MTSLLLDGFEPPVPFRHGDIERHLYVSSAGKVPLVVLHELPGMSPSFISYCSEMAKNGFRIYMPLLFMTPNTELKSPVSQLALCIRKEFRELFAAQKGNGHARPFTAWMLSLIQNVHEQNPDRKVGVVGMCLTGGFALAAIAKPSVHAAIACQPSMPIFGDMSTLGLSKAERENMSKRAKTLPAPCAKGYRFSRDWISRDGHMEAAKEILGDGFKRHPDLPSKWGLPGTWHSTLTGPKASDRVFTDVLEFLNERLK
jgi:dienelactone hydrolase